MSVRNTEGNLPPTAAPSPKLPTHCHSQAAKRTEDASSLNSRRTTVDAFMFAHQNSNNMECDNTAAPSAI